MERITADMTTLNEFGMTPEMILGGERAEIDPEPKTDKKTSYIRYDFATKLVDAYADDLLLAYRTVQEMEAEVTRLTQELSQAQSEAASSKDQAQRLLSGESSFAEAEKLLATFEQQLESLAASKQADESMIENLSAQVQELIELRDTVPQLKEDVNAVLNNLRSYFEEEGIEMPDGNYDDDLSG